MLETIVSERLFKRDDTQEYNNTLSHALQLPRASFPSHPFFIIGSFFLVTPWLLLPKYFQHDENYVNSCVNALLISCRSRSD